MRARLESSEGLYALEDITGLESSGHGYNLEDGREDMSFDFELDDGTTVLLWFDLLEGGNLLVRTLDEEGDEVPIPDDVFALVNDHLVEPGSDPFQLPGTLEVPND